jgi:hypothetical protein
MKGREGIRDMALQPHSRDDKVGPAAAKPEALLGVFDFSYQHYALGDLLTIGFSWGHTPLAPALSEANRWLAAGRGLDPGCHPGSTQFDPEKEAGP